MPPKRITKSQPRKKKAVLPFTSEELQVGHSPVSIHILSPASHHSKPKTKSKKSLKQKDQTQLIFQQKDKPFKIDEPETKAELEDRSNYEKKEEKLSLHLGQAKNYLNYYRANQFDYYKRPGVSISRTTDLMFQFCNERNIELIDYFFIAPKWVFAKFVHHFLKMKNEVEGDITIDEIQDAFNSHFGEQISDQRVTYLEPLKSNITFLLKLSLIQIIKLGGDNIACINQLTSRLRCFPFYQAYSAYYNEPMPPQIDKHMVHYSPTPEDIELRIRTLLELKANEIIMHILDNEYLRYYCALQELLKPGSDAYLTECLCQYSEKSQDDNYLMKFLQFQFNSLCKHEHHVGKQRYIIYILLVLFNLPKQHKYLNSKKHKRFIPMIIAKLIRSCLLNQYTALPLLASCQIIYQIGELDSEPQVFSLFLDGVMFLQDIIFNENRDKTRLKGKDMVFPYEIIAAKVEQVLRFLVKKASVFHNEYYLVDVRYSDIRKQIEQKFRSKIQNESVDTKIQDLVLGLKNQIAAESGNMFKVYLTLKSIKYYFQIKSPKLKAVLQPLIRYIKKNDFILKSQQKKDRTSLVIVKIFSLIFDLMVIYGNNQEHLDIGQLHGDNWIVDDFKCIQNTFTSFNPAPCFEWMREYILIANSYFNLYNFNCVLMEDRLDSLVQKRSKNSNTNKKPSFFQIVNKAACGTQKEKLNFLKLFYMVENSYGAVVGIIFYIIRFIQVQKKQNIVRFINLIYSEKVMSQSLPKIEQEGCLHVLEAAQSIKHFQKDQSFAQKISYILKHLDHDRLSCLLEVYGYPKQSLFHLQRLFEWNSAYKIQDNYLIRCYNLHNRIHPDMIVFSFQEIKKKYTVAEHQSQQEKTASKSRLQQQNKILNRIKKVCEDINVQGDNSLGKWKHFHDLFYQQYEQLIDQIFHLNTRQQQERQYSLVMTVKIMWYYSAIINNFSMQQNQKEGKQSVFCSEWFKDRLDFRKFQTLVEKILKSVDYVHHKIFLLEFLFNDKMVSLKQKNLNSNDYLDLMWFVTQTLFHTYLIHKETQKADLLLKKEICNTSLNFNTMHNQALLCYERQNIIDLGIMFDLVDPVKDVGAKHKRICPEDIITLDCCLKYLSRQMFVNDNFKKALHFLQHIPFNAEFQYVKNKPLDHFCSVLNTFYLQFKYTLSQIERLLKVIEAWIIQCDRYKFYNNCEIIGAYYVRFYIKKAEINFKTFAEKYPTEKQWQSNQANYIKQIERNFKLIGNHPLFFKQAHKACISQLTGKDTLVYMQIKVILCKLAEPFPNDAIWWVMMLKNYKFNLTDIQLFLWDDKDDLLVQIGEYIFSMIHQKCCPNTIKFIEWTYNHFTEGKHEKKKNVKLNKYTGLNYRTATLPQPATIPFKQPLKFSKFGEVKQNFSSKCQTKVIKLIMEDNSEANILLKGEFSKRNLQNQSKFVEILEDLIPSQLQITYSIIQLSKYFIMVEFLQGYKSLLRLKKEKELPDNSSLRLRIDRKGKGVYNEQDFNLLYSSLKPVLPLCLEMTSAYKWWNNAMNYTRTTAVWSIICYILGLGDRHGDNIMMNVENGKVAHVDFECSFDSGKILGYPEHVHFRFTPNIQAPLGILGCYGPFIKYALDQIYHIQRYSYRIVNDLLQFDLPFTKRQTKDIMNTIILRTGENGKGIFSQRQMIELIMTLTQTSKNPKALERMYIGWDPAF